MFVDRLDLLLLRNKASFHDLNHWDIQLAMCRNVHRNESKITVVCTKHNELLVMDMSHSDHRLENPNSSFRK